MIARSVYDLLAQDGAGGKPVVRPGWKNHPVGNQPAYWRIPAKAATLELDTRRPMKPDFSNHCQPGGDGGKNNLKETKGIFQC